MEERLVYIDGEFYPKSQAKVSVFDHGYLYGDGIFEGIRAYNGRIFRCKEHIDRLYMSAKAIAMEIPLTKQQMIEALKETCRRNNINNGYIRLVVSRGEGSLAISPVGCIKPCVVIIADAVRLYPQEMYETGLKVITASTRRNYAAVVDPQVKSLNYLNNVLAQIEANRAGVPEAIMLDMQGNVCECTADNIFIVGRGEVITPPAYVGALNGITKQVVIEICTKLGYKVSEKEFTLYSLYNADECFLTGTAAEVIAVTEADGRVIGTGSAGPITMRILQEFWQVTKEGGENIYS